MNRLTPSRIAFIESQPMFFVATAAAEGRVNVSPKGMDTLRILDPQRIVWLNLTGSGNETAAHVAATGRMTLMCMSITDQPLLDIIGHPVATNPDPLLYREAVRRRWPVRFFDPPEPA